MRIEEIDKNFKPTTIDGRDDIVFLNVREAPFSVYGLYNYKEDPYFHRMSSEVAKQLGEGISELERYTAGGRVRFSTDADVVVIRCKMPQITHASHMPMTGTSGFDLYRHKNGVDTYLCTFIPPYDMTDGFTASSFPLGDGRMHSYTVHFPLYNEVTSLEIGIPMGAHIDVGAPYKDMKPIVYYGSSITHGGCASRPGNTYQSIISAKRNIDHINLGFAGNAKAEDIMVNYLASLDMSLFVCDYDHNAPDAAHLRATHEKLYDAVRAAHPDLPILFVTKPDGKYTPEDIERQRVIEATYDKAYRENPRLAGFINGHTLFGTEYHDACTVDGAHPNDAGFVCMADVIGAEIDRLLSLM